MSIRSSKCHDYKFGLVLQRGDGTYGKACGGFRADRANAETEAARLNREIAAHAVRASALWVVVPAVEITAAEFRALNKKEVSK